MKRIFVLAGTSALILTVGLTGISFSKEKAPAKKMSPAGQVKTTQSFEAESDKSRQEVIAKVNRTDITMRELVVEMNQIAPQFIKDGEKRTPEIDKKVKETALGILIFRELAIQEAVRQGLKARPSAVEEARKQLKQGLGSDDNYKNYLRKMDLTEESLRKLLERDILFNQITIKEIFEKAKANDKKAIEKRKEQWERGLKKKAKIVILQP